MDEADGNLNRVYFAHPVNVYNTPLEEAVIRLIQFFFPGAEVENPNQPRHQVGYANYARRAKESSTVHKGMNYFFDEVLPLCGGCVAMPFLDGRIGLGAAGEAKWSAVRSLPVWITVLKKEPTAENLEAFVQNPRSGLFTVRPITKAEGDCLINSDPRLVVPHEETRLRTWKIYNREKRPYEEAHLVSLPIPPGFYPEKS